jgi:hypothetical protein
MPVKRKKAKPKTKAKVKTRAKRPKGKAWTAEQIKSLRVGYKTKPASKIAKELKRSLASVRGKISALGLTKGPAKKKAKPKPKPKVKARAKAKPKPKRKAKAKAKAKKKRR